MRRGGPSVPFWDDSTLAGYLCCVSSKRVLLALRWPSTSMHPLSSRGHKVLTRNLWRRQKHLCCQINRMNHLTRRLVTKIRYRYSLAHQSSVERTVYPERGAGDRINHRIALYCSSCLCHSTQPLKMASTSPADADKAVKAGEAKRRIAGVSISTESLHRAGLGSVMSRSERRFDVNKLPADMLRVYRALEEKYGEEYALLFVFTMRTAIEMHRAWHMTRK